jgi:hypothetical protein
LIELTLPQEIAVMFRMHDPGQARHTSGLRIRSDSGMWIKGAYA